jgi:hypothetical protein
MGGEGALVPMEGEAQGYRMGVGAKQTGRARARGMVEGEE